MPSRTSNISPQKKSGTTTPGKFHILPDNDNVSGYRALPSKVNYPREKKLLIINPNTSTAMTDLIYDMLLSRGE
jgi:hypothetical protein